MVNSGARVACQQAMRHLPRHAPLHVAHSARTGAHRALAHGALAHQADHGADDQRDTDDHCSPDEKPANTGLRRKRSMIAHSPSVPRAIDMRTLVAFPREMPTAICRPKSALQRGTRCGSRYAYSLRSCATRPPKALLDHRRRYSTTEGATRPPKALLDHRRRYSTTRARAACTSPAKSRLSGAVSGCHCTATSNRSPVASIACSTPSPSRAVARKPGCASTA